MKRLRALGCRDIVVLRQPDPDGSRPVGSVVTAVEDRTALDDRCGVEPECVGPDHGCDWLMAYPVDWERSLDLEASSELVLRCRRAAMVAGGRARRHRHGIHAPRRAG